MLKKFSGPGYMFYVDPLEVAGVFPDSENQQVVVAMRSNTVLRVTVPTSGNLNDLSENLGELIIKAATSGESR